MTRKTAIVASLLVHIAVGVLLGVKAHGQGLQAPTLYLRSQVKQFSTNYFSDSKLSPRSQDFIIQFKTVPSAEAQVTLAKNFRILSYIPDHAFVIRGKFTDIKKYTNARRDVHALIPFEEGMKLSPDLGASSVFNQNEYLKVLIKCYRFAGCDDLQVKLKDFGLVVLDSSKNDIAVNLQRKHLLPIAQRLSVEHIQPFLKFENFALPLSKEDHAEIQTQEKKPLDGTESGTQAMGFSAAWLKGYSGSGQIGAFADTGLDTGDLESLHEDLLGRVLMGQALGLYSYSWEDPNGHGTHVAGSIAGGGVLSNGILKGGAYNSMLIAQGMWSERLENFTVPSKLALLFDGAFQEGVHVHNNSWGSVLTPGAYDASAAEVDEWMYQHPEMLIVFAAGNSGADKDKDGRIDSGSLATPGTSKNALTVGASENDTSTGGIQVPLKKLHAARDLWSAEPLYSSHPSDNLNGLAMFSSRGPTMDGRIKPDLVAPGSNILSLRSQVESAMELWGVYDKNYVWSGGTSMAAPLVSGAALIAREILIKKRGMKKPSSALLKALLMNSTIDMYPGQFGEVGKENAQEILTRRPNADQGFGRLHVERLVQASEGALLVDHEGLSQGQEFDVEFEVPAGKNVYANLVWSDPAATPNAGKILVNDLDLEFYRQGELVAKNEDRLNNFEVLEIEELSGGLCKIKIRAHRVLQIDAARQPFALVISVN